MTVHPLRSCLKWHIVNDELWDIYIQDKTATTYPNFVNYFWGQMI